MLLEYMAIQWIRVPTFRALVGRTVYSHFSKDVLSSLEVWQKAKRTRQVAIHECNDPFALPEPTLGGQFSAHESR
jgi:hypothetical protein